MRPRWYGILAVLVCSAGVVFAGETESKTTLETALRLQNAGKLAEAERMLTRGLADATHPSAATPVLLGNLASVYQDEMRYLDAEKTYRQSLAAYESAGGARSLQFARTLNNLASILWETEKPQAVEGLLARSRSLQVELAGHADAETLWNLGTLRLRQRKWAAAEQPYREMLDLRAPDGHELPESAPAAVRLAAIYGRLRQTSKVSPLLERASRIWSEQRDTADPKVLLDLAESYLTAGLHQDALRILQHATESRLRNARPVTAYAILRLYAAALRKSNRKDEAREAEIRAAALDVSWGNLRLAQQTVEVAELRARR